MQGKLVTALVGAGLFFVVSSAHAATITYDLVGVTATFSGGTDTLTGSFAFDPTTSTLSAVNIVVTGPVFPNTFNSPATPVSANTISGFDGLESVVTIHFLNNLGLLPDTVSSVTVGFPISGSVTSTSATGQAVPQIAATPLPAALPLFATGLGALGLFGWRRKKKAAALAG